MTNSIEKQAEYVSCRFVHHSAVFCQLFSFAITGKADRKLPIVMNSSRHLHSSRTFTGSMIYAQLCTSAIKITTFHNKMRVGSGGNVPSLGK